MPEYIEKERVVFAIVGEQNNSTVDVARALEKAKRIVADAPAVDVAPVMHGFWEWRFTGYGVGDGEDAEEISRAWSCSRCGRVVELDIQYSEDLPNYCPNCGAKMDESRTDEKGGGENNA